MPAARPTSLRPSAAYKQPTSLRAEIAAAWDVDTAVSRARIDQLARMEPIMRTTLLRSIGDAAVEMPFEAAEQRVLEDGAPLVFTYLYTDDGFYSGLPGTWETYDSPGGVGWDHRREDWYKEARATRGTYWTVASDASQFGLTVSCFTTIRDDRGAVIGVAGVDLWFDRFIVELLEVPALAGSAEALLLDKSGAVLVRSSDKRVGARGVGWVPKPCEDATLRELVIAGPKSGKRTHDGKLAVWTRLGSAGLVYLVIGDEAKLL